jgi:hypothetical protein
MGNRREVRVRIVRPGEDPSLLEVVFGLLMIPVIFVAGWFGLYLLACFVGWARGI